MPERSLPKAAKHFHELSDDARMSIDAVEAVVGKCRTSIFRAYKAGKFPSPQKDFSGRNFWTVGAVRKALTQAA